MNRWDITSSYDGRVTDFIDIGLGTTRWPTFELADACIVPAVVAILLSEKYRIAVPRPERMGR